jgi:hypothetical protein
MTALITDAVLIVTGGCPMLLTLIFFFFFFFSGNDLVVRVCPLEPTHSFEWRNQDRRIGISLCAAAGRR